MICRYWSLPIVWAGGGGRTLPLNLILALCQVGIHFIAIIQIISDHTVDQGQGECRILAEEFLRGITFVIEMQQMEQANAVTGRRIDPRASCVRKSGSVIRQSPGVESSALFYQGKILEGGRGQEF